MNTLEAINTFSIGQVFTTSEFIECRSGRPYARAIKCPVRYSPNAEAGRELSRDRFALGIEHVAANRKVIGRSTRSSSWVRTAPLQTVGDA